MRIGYLDCFSGISGDMLLGALIGAGWPESELQSCVDSLGLEGLRVKVSRETIQGLAAVRVRVTSDRSQPLRHLAQVRKVLEQATLPAEVRQQAMDVFQRLAKAEAAVHGCSPDQVHFHEVGAVDALVDVVGTVTGLAWLKIKHLACSPLPMPSGFVRCAHGELPLPAPAVCELLRGVPVYGVNLDQELVTPTGAALARELALNFGPLPPMRLEQTGYGAGTRQRRDGRPNLLRLMAGQGFQAREAQRVEVIETHLDDWNGELWPHVSQRLMDSGALDVSLTTMLMKKGRPGYLLRVLTDPAHGPELRQVILTETSAIGLRVRMEERLTLDRRSVTLETPWGPVQAKEIDTPSGPVITPEYEACCRLARQHGLPLQTVYRTITAAASGRQCVKE
ncbi:nickel pincer cofactor biosynthesis protein LarC [Desulfolithobacter sp.]